MKLLGNGRRSKKKKKNESDPPLLSLIGVACVCRGVTSRHTLNVGFLKLAEVRSRGIQPCGDGITNGRGLRDDDEWPAK